MKVRLTALAAFSAAAMTATAADVTVNSSLPLTGSNYHTVGSALAFVYGEGTTPDTVRITGGGPYVEAGLLLNKSVTIRGDGYRPTLVLAATAGGPATETNGNAISIYTDASSGGPISVTLDNFVLLPQATGILRGIRSHNNAGTLTGDEMDIFITDVLITSKAAAANTPVSTDGLSYALDANPGYVSFDDDATFFSGNSDVSTTRIICTNITGVSTNDGLVFNPAIPHQLNIGPGCVFSYMKRVGIQVASDGNTVRIEGTAASPVVLKGNYLSGTANPALALWGDDNGNPALRTVLKHIVLHENNSFALQQNLPDVGESIIGIDADHLAIFNNQNSAISIPSATERQNFITSSTIINNGLQAAAAPQMAFSGNLPGSYTFTDCVIGGDGTPGDPANSDNLINNSSPNLVITFQNSSLIASGPYALGTAKYTLPLGGLQPVENEVIYDDPLLLNVSNQYTAPDFLQVTASEYAAKATGEADLSGYGTYGGASVQGWNLY